MLEAGKRAGFLEVTVAGVGPFALKPEAIACVVPANVARAFVGVNASIQDFTGRWYEVYETQQEIYDRMNEAKANA